MTVRLQVTFSPAEADALAKLAYSELRDPRDQIRFIICQELKRLKLLPEKDEEYPGGVSLREMPK